MAIALMAANGGGGGKKGGGAMIGGGGCVGGGGSGAPGFLMVAGVRLFRRGGLLSLLFRCSGGGSSESQLPWEIAETHDRGVDGDDSIFDSNGDDGGST